MARFFWLILILSILGGQVWANPPAQIDWQPIQQIQGQHGWLYDVAWSPDGGQLAGASADGVVLIWDAQSGSTLQALTGHTASAVSVDWFGGQLASSSLDNTVMIWDANTGQHQLTVTDHLQDVWSVAWSPNGQWLASGGADPALGLWSSAGLRYIQGGHTAPIYAVAWSPYGSQVGTAGYDGQMIVWDVASGGAVAALSTSVAQLNALAWSPDGAFLLAGGESPNLVMFDLANQAETLIPTEREAIYSVAFHPSGELAAVGDLRGNIDLVAIPSGEILGTLAGHTSLISGLAFNADGSQLASSSYDGSVIIWQP